jgi:hypothetical protein
MLPSGAVMLRRYRRFRSIWYGQEEPQISRFVPELLRLLRSHSLGGLRASLGFIWLSSRVLFLHVQSSPERTLKHPRKLQS